MSLMRARRRGQFFGNFLGHAADLSPSSSAVRQPSPSHQRQRKARLEQLEPRLALANDLLGSLAVAGKTLVPRPDGWLPAETAELPGPADSVHKSIVPGEIIVSFTGDVDVADLEMALANNLALSRVDLGGKVALTHLLTTTPTTDHGVETLISLQLGDFADVKAVGDIIEEQVAGVAWTQPNFAYTGAIKEFTPNDPFYSAQDFHLQTQTNLAWDTTLGSPSIIIAVTDDGLQLDHPDLAANVYINPDEIAGNGIDDDNNTFIDDVNGWDFVTNDNNVTPVAAADSHGTSVAGIIAARTNNAVGVAGVAGRSTIMPVRFAGTDGGFTSTIILNSFRYAADNGARIVNTSYDIDEFVGDSVFTSALQYLYDNNILHVNSAGNVGQENPTRQAFHQTLLVAQTNEFDEYGGHSNYGIGIDITAPGDNIATTVLAGQYQYTAGTSMAAAIVSGAAALIWSANPALTRDQVATRLLGLTDNIDSLNPGFGGMLGSGRVNPNKAITGTVAPPKLTGLREVPNTPNPSIFPVNRLNVMLGSVLDKTTVETAANWSLVGAGVDNTLGTADDVPVPLTRINPYLIGANDVTFSFPMLSAGSYRFTAVSGGLRNPFNTALDGDANGTAGGNFVKDFQVTLGTSVFSADFSDAGGAASNEGFLTSGATGQWHLSTGRGNDPGHSTDDSMYFGTGETSTGGGLYNNLAVGSITSPLIDLTAFAGPIRLDFNHFLKSEEDFDFASIAIVEGGGARTVVESADGLPHDTTGWEAAYVDLSEYAGRIIRVRFTFTADDSFTEEGWYVDDVVVRAQVPTLAANLSGQVWNDLNGNRVREAGENGLAGWTVYLDGNNNGTLDSPVTNIPSTNVPLPIVDASSMFSTTTVSGLTGLITDLDVTVNLTHTWVSDLDLILRSPTGFRILLASEVGADGDNFTNVRFDDEAAASITTGTPPFTGSFKPQGTTLSALDGTNPNGTWALEIGDFAYEDAGNLLGWTLHITTQEPNRVTTAAGDYAFNNVPIATHVIREVLQPTWNQSVPIAGFYSVTPTNGQSLTNLDFANSQGPVLPPTFQVTAMTPTPTGYILDFNGDLDVTTLNLYDTQGGGIGPVDLTLLGAAGGGVPVRGTATIEPNLRRLTFVATNGLLPPDTYTLTLRSATDGFRDSTATLLDGDANGTPGGNYTSSPIVVAAPPANAVAVSLPNITRGPRQAVNMPATGTTGIPISLSNASGITTANFTLTYNPAMLSITGGTVAPGLTGATVNVNTTTPGTAIVQFSSPTPLPAGATRFVDLQATVPDTAPYASKQVLNLSFISLNGGAIASIDDDAIHVAAFFGDANGSNTYTSGDAATTSRIAIGLDQGLLSYKLIDPVLIIDLNQNGLVSSADTSMSLQVAVGTPVASVPVRPAGTITPAGPDPKLSIPQTLTAPAGGDLTIPVEIDSIVDLTGNGLLGADLVLFFDPAVLTVNSVNLGSLLADSGGWMISSRIDPVAGSINVSLASITPLEGSFIGDLVELQATVAANATAGATAINLAASSKGGQFTMLNDANLTLIPAPTDADNDSIDGLLTISSLQPSTSEAATVQLIANQLLVTGTNASDRILVATLANGLVRVRAGSQVLGDFAGPTEILIDGLGGSDLISAGTDLPTLISTAANDLEESDLVFGGTTAQWFDDQRFDDQRFDDNGPSSRVNDLALMQLLPQWSNGATSLTPTARPLRLARR